MGSGSGQRTIEKIEHGRRHFLAEDGRVALVRKGDVICTRAYVSTSKWQHGCRQCGSEAAAGSHSAARESSEAATDTAAPSTLAQKPAVRGVSTFLYTGRLDFLANACERSEDALGS